MVELVVMALGFKAIEGGALWVFLQRRKRKRLLDNTDTEPMTIPLVDKTLERLAGEPNKVEAFANKKLVSAIRKTVDTKAFEHMVALAMNHKSELRDKQVKVLNLPVNIQL